LKGEHDVGKVRAVHNVAALTLKTRLLLPRPKSI